MFHSILVEIIDTEHVLISFFLHICGFVGSHTPEETSNAYTFVYTFLKTRDAIKINFKIDL